MKRFAFAILSLALIALLFAAPASTHAAAEGVLCWADSYELSIGQSTGIYCTGFSPNTIVNVYYVEAGGTAVFYGNAKTDENGSVAFGYGNGFEKFYSNQLGTYTFVIQQLGPAKSIVAFGKVEIRNTGTGDHVSGATLTSDKSVIDRTQDDLTLTGSGFAPGEVISLWGQRPTLCNSYTSHYVDGNNGFIFDNVPNVDDYSAYGLFDIKVNSAGAFAFTGSFGPDSCEGTYRFAVRGNTSNLGAYVDVSVTGHSVSTNAWLVPSKESVGALFDSIEFYASGFGANEILNCWTTSPDGRALEYGSPGSFSEIKVGADGSGVISLSTGSFWTSEDHPIFTAGKFPFMSEGSLGVWKLTCKGGATGATAIAEYTVHGYETAP